MSLTLILLLVVCSGLLVITAGAALVVWLQNHQASTHASPVREMPDYKEAKDWIDQMEKETR